MSEKQSPFAMYVSSKKGRIVSRYGTATLMNANQWIGVSRDPKDPVWGELLWDEDAVTALTHAEVARFGREYEKSIAEGSLVKRTEADFRAYVKRQKDRQKAVLAAQARENDAAQKAAAPKKQTQQAVGAGEE